MARARGGKGTPEWQSIAFEASQIFTPSLPLNENDLFAGRLGQIKRMLNATGEPGKHVVLYGEQGVGKTSLAKLLAGFFPKTLRHVFHVREQADPTDDYSSIWRKVFKDIHVEIERNGHPATAPVASFYQGQITPDDIRRELSSLFGPNDLPIIVIDEFDKIKSFEARELMANTLKSLSDFGVNVTIVLVGVADDVNDLIVGHPSVTRCIEQILMPRMEVNEREEILDKRIGRLGMSMRPSAALKISNLSRGLPSYVHSLGLASVQSALNRETLRVEDADVDQALGKVLSRSHQSIQEAYLQSIHSNRKDNLYGEVLLACALADTDEKGLFTPLSVSEPLSLVLKKDKPISISTYQSHLLKFMEDARANVLIRRGRERAYRFRFKDPIMQPYVIMKGIEAGLIGRDAIDVLPPSFRKKLPAT